MDYKISEEIAEEQFKDLCDFYGIDLSDFDQVDSSGDVDTSVSDMYKRKVIRFIRSGMIEIVNGDKGIIVRQNLRFPVAEGSVKSIEYGVLTGRARRAVDEKKPYTVRMLQLLAAVSKESIPTIESLVGTDFAAAEVIAGLFAAV